MNTQAEVWPLDPAVTFLNHGSFGSCPRPVLACQRALQDRLERQPLRFLVRDLEGLLDEARAALAAFVGADADDLVFVTNATAGVNTVLRSLRFEAGDELLLTHHEYNACRNAAEFAAQRAGARVVVAEVRFPLASPEEVIEAVLGRVSPKTRLALLDHVTSPTGLVFPIERLVSELAARGIDTLVDGAHGPGMVPLNLAELGAAYYTGNCHKWLCAPKTAAFLHVRRERQAAIRPLVISHGANSPRTDRSRFLLEFGWPGTSDPTPYLSVPEAIRCVGALRPGGWPEVMRHNRELALAGRRILCDALGVPLPCPDAMLGALAAVPLPNAPAGESPVPPLLLDPLQNTLLANFGIEVPVMSWPARPQRLVRISAQLYNAPPDYERLAKALVEALDRPSAPARRAAER